ncbi:hypothetical protein ISN45_Aa08g000800 [Arabidopsis thaliana x Arabidopsis arenosa]|uniref:Uncharacterized protein n=1 Tax=Arabidopsis thaliana x Arabidopsis arenosa TaxID=1240361 RepID=A0A8T1XLQ0_9BRAS|nr:hypothetical protein ISN45_Aa08g000800 [Arabidopsis thaliana x Arabidopsis arenosa]
MGRNMARPAERWSETLMRRAEEAKLVTRIREEESKQEKEEEEAKNPPESSSSLGKATDILHDREQNNKVDTLTARGDARYDGSVHINHATKVLIGRRSSTFVLHRVKHDETLDDHWLREIGLDAEEKYFGEED